MRAIGWALTIIGGIWLGVFVAEILWYICQGIRAAY